MENYFDNATALDIYGIELHEDSDRLQKKCETLSKNGVKIRVLLADPNGSVVNMVKLRFPPIQPTSIALAESIKTTIRRFGGLGAEIKTLDYLFPRKVYFFYQEEGNVAFVSDYTYHYADEKAKYILRKNKGRKEHSYYTLYKDEFDSMWKDAKDYEEGIEP